jgi:hypothetical protein
MLSMDGRAGIFAAGYALALLLFVATGKQAAGNYYFLVTHALLLAAVARLGMRSPIAGQTIGAQ